MKDLEDKLFNMQIPQAREDQNSNGKFKSVLRKRLVDKYFNVKKNYARKLHYSLAFTTLLALILISLIIFPEISYNVNKIAFKTKEIATDNVERTYTDDEFFADFAENSEKFYYTSIHNPALGNKIDPKKYQEEKTYLIRKYVSEDSPAIMIISEFGKTEEKKNFREVSF
ncbi:MAG: hypothetical protein K9N07_06255 [Candidatus Cloacimonetes bacterium]|nr:hypothetical protein [Candidatus Cloacimonadota bacterium]